MTDQDYEKNFCWIPWREPATIIIPPTIQVLACRYCIARKGLRAAEIDMSDYVFLTREQALRHLSQDHPNE